MAHIVFNAFSFLKKKLAEKNIACTDTPVDVVPGQQVKDVLAGLGIVQSDIEGVFVNGKISPLDTPVQDGDRVAAFPPGTPGPYRLLLGMVRADGEYKSDEN